MSKGRYVTKMWRGKFNIYDTLNKSFLIDGDGMMEYYFTFDEAMKRIYELNGWGKYHHKTMGYV